MQPKDKAPFSGISEVWIMTCDECDWVLLNSSDAASGNGWMLRESVMNLARSHVKNCPACAAKMSEAAKLNEAIEQLRVFTRQLEAPAALEANLVAAFRQETKRRFPATARAFPWKLGWALAAVFLLTPAGSILYSTLRSSSQIAVRTDRKHVEHQSENRSLVNLPGTSERALAETYQTGARSVSVSAKNNTKYRGKRTPAPSTSRSSVPVSDELSLNGGGSIIRVTLPLSSLAAMGIPVHSDISDPRVMTDVVMDPFGAVMGIRLVEVKPSAN
jgi:hypothetical protein